MAEETTNVNTEYEILSQEIYKCLLKSEGFTNVDVKHNVKIEGKSGCKHQIDVYWEFQIAGDTHRVAIECKNYSSEVSVGKVRDFFGVIHDIGNIKGIFITKVGYQSGAKKFGDYYGIKLKEVRFPKKEDWAGRLKTIQVDIVTLPIRITGLFIEPDYKWLIENGHIKSEDEKDQIKIDTVGKLNSEVFIYDSNNNPIESILDLENKLPHNMKEGTGFKHAFKYDDGYIESNFGKIKIAYVGFQYDIETMSSELIIEAEEVTKAIIKDVESGDIKFISTDGEVK